MQYSSAKKLYIISQETLKRGLQLACSWTDLDDKDKNIRQATKHLAAVEKSLITTEELLTTHLSGPRLSLASHSSDEKQEKYQDEKENKSPDEKKPSHLSFAAKRHFPKLSVGLALPQIDPSEIFSLGASLAKPQASPTPDRSIFSNSFSLTSGMFASPAKPLPALHCTDEVKSRNDANHYDEDEKEEKKDDIPTSPMP